jgi:hypothetical protein
MNIHHTEYNVVIDGLRKQLELQRRFMQEKASGMQALKEQVRVLETIIGNSRLDLEWRIDIKALTVFRDGDEWIAVRPDFKNFQESECWNGKTPASAIGKALLADRKK